MGGHRINTRYPVSLSIRLSQDEAEGLDLSCLRYLTRTLEVVRANNSMPRQGIAEEMKIALPPWITDGTEYHQFTAMDSHKLTPPPSQ